ncbi:DUF6602 domain-containing protein [Thiomicrorhabdus sp.]|uniref:DUF6602 domain-containing protein n=1 Tax=Thiomicrorhabdus sp. TaxID=2039724 RepID=UPI0029C82DD9|nr:DUF6602 domain-containing protein [Thiomicrorhabdus sp.]
MNTLIEILKKEGRTISEEFKAASSQGNGTSQEIADFRENAVHDFIERYFPANHVISKGKITDLDGNQSNSIDCLILNPAHPNLIDSKGKFRIIFSDGCDAAIEVKPDLSRTDEIQRGLKQGVSVKKIHRSKSSILLPKREQEHILEHSLYIPFYIFCVKAFEINKLLQTVTDYYSSNSVPLEEQVDGIVILDVGVLRNIKHKELNIYGAPPPVGKNSGWYFEAWGDSTLLGMLINIEYSYSSIPGVTDSIMKRVLTKIGNTNVTRLSGN